MSAPVRTGFVTHDVEEGCALVAAAYAGNRLRISGTVEHFRFEQSRYDLGRVRIDTFTNTLTTQNDVDPLGCVVICRMLDGTLEITTGRRERRFGPGDVFCLAHPDRGYFARGRRTRLQLVGIDLPQLARVAGEAAPALTDRLRYEPLAPAVARQWQRTVDYLTGSLLVDPTVVTGPLVLDSARRLLSATALAAFTTDPVADPVDRIDATPATLRRALAFIDAAPDADIGLADIARAACVTPRAVQLAFRRHLDTTPLAYLRRVRLEQAHRQLRTSTPDDGTTVTAVAARWGFTPSRFTERYRAAYGLLPSHTLRA